MNVLIVRVDQEPAVENLPDTSLKTLYRVLECETVQAVDIGGGITAWMDEDGITNGKPPNGCGFLGTYFFATSRNSQIAGLSSKQVDKCLAYWKVNRNRKHSGESDLLVQSFDSFADMVDVVIKDRAARDRDFRSTQ